MNLLQKNQKRIETEEMIYDQMFTFRGKVIIYKYIALYNTIYLNTKDINLCIQTSKSESKCIENLKELFTKIDTQKLESKGFINIGISLNQYCGNKYLMELMRSINKIIEEDSYLSFPSEI